MNNELFVTAGEVAQELGVSKPFAYKLVRQMMNTTEGRKLAEHRHAVMQAFLDEFMAEWGCEGRSIQSVVK